MKFFLPLLFGASMFASVYGQEVFVSPKGDDANSGTIEKPFRTLERARTAVLAYQESTPAGNRKAINVWLRAGTYSLARTFELTRQDAGTPGAPVTYAPYRHEPVRISGGITIPSASFHPAMYPGILRRLPPESRQHVVQADLRALGVSDLGKHRQFRFMQECMPGPRLIGYACVSTVDQDLSLQIDALTREGIP